MPNPTPKARSCNYCGSRYFFQNNKTEYCSEKCRVYAWRDRKALEKKQSKRATMKRALEQVKRDKNRKK